MTIDNKTIIISCAGMGTRLKMNTPKALIDICGKPLLIRSLEMLDNVADIRIVVGYKADEVIKLAKDYRKDLTFVYNHDYVNTGTGASVLLAAKDAKQFILTIDGDIIIHPDDIKDVLETNHEFVGVCNPSTEGPVLVQVDSKSNVTRFSRDNGTFEWTGVTLLKSANLHQTSGHTYQIVEPSLPLPFKLIRQREIDTPNDYRNAINWVKNNYQ
jgi:choline kinase